MKSRYESLPDAGTGKCEFCGTVAPRKSVPDINDYTHWALCRNCACWALIYGIRPKGDYVRERNPGEDWHMKMARAASRDRNMQAATAHSVSAVESRRLGMKNLRWNKSQKDYTVMFKEGPVFVTATNQTTALAIAREQVARSYPGHTTTPRKVYVTTAAERVKYPEVFGKYVSRKWVGNPGAAWHLHQSREYENKEKTSKGALKKEYSILRHGEYRNAVKSQELRIPNPISSVPKKKFPWLIALGAGALILWLINRNKTQTPITSARIRQSEVDREIIR